MHTNSDRRLRAVGRFYRPFSLDVQGPVCVTLAPITYPPSSFYPVSSPLDRSSLILLVLRVLPLCLGLGVVFEMGILGWFPLFPGCNLAPFCGLMEPWFLFFFLTDRLIFSVLFSLFSLFPFNVGNRRVVFFCVLISRTPKHCQPPPGWSSTSRLCIFLAPATLLCLPLSSFRLALCVVFSAPGSSVSTPSQASPSTRSLLCSFLSTLSSLFAFFGSPLARSTFFRPFSRGFLFSLNRTLNTYPSLSALICSPSPCLFCFAFVLLLCTCLLFSYKLKLYRYHMFRNNSALVICSRVFPRDFRFFNLEVCLPVLTVAVHFSTFWFLSVALLFADGCLSLDLFDKSNLLGR